MEMGRTYHVNLNQKNLRWSKNVSPVVIVNSGETVSFDTLDGSNGQITKASDVSAISRFDVSMADPVFGPVFVRGAEPGDALEIEILELQAADWGWTAIVPGFGLLSDEFTEGHLKIWNLSKMSEQNYAVFKEGIHIPARPFLGIMGVAPGEDGDFPTIPPLDTGGNIDCRHLTVGTRLFLPVRTVGALFSCGDGHAAQGDGEICGSAIETPMRATLRLTVRKNCPWVNSPHYHCPPAREIAGFEDRGCYAAMGVDSDLLKATQKAVRGIIDYLRQTRGLSREEAYMLASVAVDLKLVEVVDMPNFAVAASIPLNIFCANVS